MSIIQKRLPIIAWQVVVFTHLAIGQTGNTTHEIVDPILKRTAVRFSAPANWRVEGAILPGSCGTDMPMAVIRASSPDGLSGYYQLPRLDWSWNSSPQYQPTAGCMPWRQTVLARDYLESLLPMWQVKKVRELDASQEMAELKPTSSRVGETTINGTWDIAKFLVHYEINGHPVDEIVQANVLTTHTFVNMNGVKLHIYQCNAMVYRLRAPQGKLPANFLLKSVVEGHFDMDWNKQWLAAWWQVKKGQIDEQYRQLAVSLRESSERNQQILTQQHNSYMQFREQQRQAGRDNFEEQQWSHQHSTDNFVDNIFDCTRLSNNVSVSGPRGNCPDRQTAPY